MSECNLISLNKVTKLKFTLQTSLIVLYDNSVCFVICNTNVTYLLSLDISTLPIVPVLFILKTVTFSPTNWYIKLYKYYDNRSKL